MVFKLLRVGLIANLLILSGIVNGQISYGGEPLFKNGGAKTKIRSVVLPKFNQLTRTKISDENLIGVKLKLASYAQEFKVNYCIDENCSWEKLEDGRRVCRFSIKSEGAYSLGLIFSEFELPVGSQLFVYNDYADRILGSYTHLNNKRSGNFSIEQLEGDELILEYIEPKDVSSSVKLVIKSVIHDYKNIFNSLKGGKNSTKELGDSGSCNVDINCLEGDDWQLEKRAVCHLSYVVNGTGYIGTGVLINNSKQDGRPYLLTAYHVIHEQEVADNAIFYFNYENSGCSFDDGERSQSISGSSLRAATSHLDFSLLELSVVPPASYRPYYAGWDRSGRIPANTTSIHHPSGDAKKISLDTDSPVTATYSDGRYTFDDNTSWQILDWEVGTTEGGSSGSPLFDENHRIIGDLTGGNASCGNSVNDYYAKFSESWDNYPNNSEQLKYWLDPLDLGVETLDGFDPYGGLLANFTLSLDTICNSSSVSVIDFSSGSPDSYLWDFGEGAVPQTANISGSHTVYYNTSGLKQIKLIVDKNGVKDSIVKNLIVQDLPVADFDYQLELLTATMLNLTIDGSHYSWSFGDGESSTEINPTHHYSSSGNYKVNLTVENVCGTVELDKEIKTSYNDQLKIYPNPSSGKYIIDLRRIIYDRIIWSVFSSKGAQVKNGVISSSSILEFDLTGLSTGIYILKVNIDGEILKRKLLLVK
ncbi:PKD domain-containing protein [Marinifilum sp.]|uniref:PKD domain-containing protein n=1 Tax=Marinifilum sp. TaxID=2033137 RepID=UPI003BA97122